jgi:hypothetical protein
MGMKMRRPADNRSKSSDRRSVSMPEDPPEIAQDGRSFIDFNAA